MPMLGYNTNDPCARTCPDCGSLQCLCRPRFFAGQLLTDEDLGRLDHYITEKIKLHNRYLVGWGVVCGLEVVCTPCSNQVTVRGGYALSPCGEDIIVCADTPVDVCALIQKCRKMEPQDCQPMQTGSPDPCAEAIEDWILSIHYDEKPSRGVVPLKGGGAACCSRCACGGSSSCGCGCHAVNGTTANGSSWSAAKSAGKTPSKPSPAQCEPTILCEGFRFEVCRTAPGEPKYEPGALVDAFLQCFNSLIGVISPPPTDPNQIHAWCCAVRDNLRSFLLTHPGTDCTLAQKLASLCQGDPAAIVSELSSILGEYIGECLCSSLLPPCPSPVDDSRVPLATIKVRKKDCQILQICNLDVRKFVTSFPNLAYWFSWIPFVRNLRALLSRVCCGPPPQDKVVFGATRVPYQPVVTAPARQSQELSEVAAQAWRNRGKTLNAQTLSMAALGLTDKDNNAFLTPLERRHPAETLLFNQLARPLVEAMIPVELARVLGVSLGEAPPDTEAEIQALNTRLKALQDELKRSQTEIEQLSKRTKQ